ncbi:hydantoinase/oxoprolinase family protein [Paenibacillus sp. LS1]|uniref:hydantoinase/oxoprolinase family protein n=1 Tax=Paenibacillus sp. LS1 TaxID=2992120 RepID=UPI002230B5A1|nr:hydantoinase/oxoprolinase family protein [Paenibacillus sp. LS1]MCW3790492.1 hydantoinase/oxoprolinase family protein [Paenibacillus sp. LS1]
MDTNYRLGIDIGGTFTDALVMDHQGKVIAALKTPSIAAAPEQAIFNALDQLKASGVNIREIDLFVHGTTLGVNTLIERNGAVTGLLVTKGFRDILEIRRLRLEDTTNLYGHKTEALVPRHRVKEVDERVIASGGILQPLNQEQLLQAVDELVEDGVTALAISFLHAYVNPAHEQLAEDLIRERYPQLFICRSSAIWPQQREFERTLATAMNAYVGERMGSYFLRLQEGIQAYGLKANLLSTMSNGGIMTAARAANEPVRTLLSGPASGVIAATHIAERAGIHQVITFDMGGTSVDVALIDKEPAYSSENKVGDFPVIIPAVDVTAIGAGGGSIAWLDSVGVLKVGPRSAGANPGPACYQRGGEEPTTTDAYLQLGILHADRFLGGQMRLYPELAERALSNLGEKLGLNAEQTAQAILDVATANMYAQFSPLMARKGVDPRDFTLLAYGGAGPMHAFLMAREVGIGRVLIPPSPGTLCAMGCTVANLRNDFVHTLHKSIQTLEPGELRSLFTELENQGCSWVDEEARGGVQLDHIYCLYSADMRYEGQAFDLEVTLTLEEIEDPKNAGMKFHTSYQNVFGISQPEAEVMFVSLRATIVGVLPTHNTVDPVHLPFDESETEERIITFDHIQQIAKVLKRGQIPSVDAPIPGPIIVEEYDTTIFIPPGYKVYRDVHGNVIGEVEA